MSTIAIGKNTVAANRTHSSLWEKWMAYYDKYAVEIACAGLAASGNGLSAQRMFGEYMKTRTEEEQ
ncbi:MAG: hypothetical protein LUF34_09655 [Lachnospiraceae bacterium]|nr:hypothetical protein [Lachnospiraceae bacterium]